MALTKQEIWEIIAPLVAAEGLVLFDLIPSPGGYGAMQVFITTDQPTKAAASGDTNGLNGSQTRVSDAASKTAVGIEDCARVSRRILDLDNIDEILPGAAELQVSSPGINRKLTRPEHFSGAIGERLKVTLLDQAGSKRSVRGLLQKFDGTSLWLQLDKSETPSAGELCVELSQVNAARVDFVF